MGLPFSFDLRLRIAKAAETMSQTEVAKIFEVSRVTVGKYVRAARAGADLKPKSGYQRGHSHKLDLETLRNYVENNPTKTLKQIGQALGIAPKTVHKGLDRLGITKKRSPTYIERDEEIRSEFLRNLEKIPEENRVFVDETGISDNEIPAYGWNYSGVIAPGKMRGKRSSRVSIAGMSRNNKIKGSLVLPGAFNGMAFLEFVKHCLIPNLRTGDVVIMDNARIHKNPMVREMIEGAGFELIFQPPYSPDLNPIEHLWAPLKECIRKKIEECILEPLMTLMDITTEILRMKTA